MIDNVNDNELAKCNSLHIRQSIILFIAKK